MITAKDVAAKLGVSVSTVGRAMAGDPRISDKTITSVRKAAEELGYVGNLAARMIRGGSSNVIGLILPDVQNDFYASIAQALSTCCDRQGYRIALSVTGDDRDAESRHIRDFVEARVAGIIIVPTAAPRRESIALVKNVPHVQLLRDVPSMGEVWFGINDQPVMEKAAEHLLSLGHRRIAYIGGSEKLSTGKARLAGVKAAVARAGKRATLDIHVGAPRLEAGEAAIKSILASKDRATGILTGSVHVTLGVLKALRERGLSVPEDFSLIGFGDPIWYQWWGPGLTTVRPPISSLATSSGLWLLDQLVRKSTDFKQHRAVSEASLIIRGSTRPLA